MALLLAAMLIPAIAGALSAAQPSVPKEEKGRRFWKAFGIALLVEVIVVAIAFAILVATCSSSGFS